jgi:hypothetical protein
LKIVCCKDDVVLLPNSLSVIALTDRRAIHPRGGGEPRRKRKKGKNQKEGRRGERTGRPFAATIHPEKRKSEEQVSNVLRA